VADFTDLRNALSRDTREVAPSLIDLFCGAGGVSAGFRQAGYRLIHSIDSWSPAVETYRRNLGEHVERQVISDGVELPNADVIAGGPPCQGFSSAGRRDGADARNSLVAVFARIVARHKPRAFVFENVEGFLTGADGQFVIDLLEPILDAGYHVHLRKVNAANYGVPQHRKRVIAIGGLGWNPQFPEPTHTAHGAPGASLGAKDLPLTPSLQGALAGLSSPLAATCNAPTDHQCRLLSGTELERARLLQPGERMRDLPEHLWHESYKRRAFRRVMDGTPTEKRGGAPAGVRRLSPDEPSKAITGGALRDFLHPSEDRMLTLRECARLQTFPDDWEFVGSKAEKMQLIGNAVPPLLAYRIAVMLLTSLQHGTTESEGPGRLLSFVPTASTGFSPALGEVQKRIRTRFCRAKYYAQGRLWD
jgi:DNA (cytosine-5)-methyltransferase 1